MKLKHHKFIANVLIFIGILFVIKGVVFKDNTPVSDKPTVVVKKEKQKKEKPKKVDEKKPETVSENENILSGKVVAKMITLNGKAVGENLVGMVVNSGENDNNTLGLEFEFHGNKFLEYINVRYLILIKYAKSDKFPIKLEWYKKDNTYYMGIRHYGYASAELGKVDLNKDSWLRLRQKELNNRK